MYSPIGRSAQFCRVLVEVPLRDLGGINQRLAWQLYNKDMYVCMYVCPKIYTQRAFKLISDALSCHKDDINVICEPLAVKHGDLELDLFSNSVLDAFIEFLCTS